MPVFSKLLIVAIFILSLCVATGSWWQQQIGQGLTLDGPQEFTVATGKSPVWVVNELVKKGYSQVRPWVAKIWLKLYFSGRQIKAGTYLLQPNSTIPDVFDLLASGDEYQFGVTLVEGQTLNQWLAVLKNNPHLSDDITPEVLSSIQRQAGELLSHSVTSLEGVLLADTYYFVNGSKSSTILRRAILAMENFLREYWPNRQLNLPYDTQYEALIMASIIEKETALAQERELIAGVFVNRLRKNMRLQTDPTVIYGIGKDFDGNLTRAHLRQLTPYNTYRIKGLPPTPIAMAGRDAIIAALHPLDTQALYFVARGDGSHYFSTTLDEHNQAVREYQLKLQDKNTQ
jgi:UPF0755 protein